MICKLIGLAQRVQEANDKWHEVDEQYGSNSLASHEAFNHYEDLEHELLGFVFENNINYYELAVSYWKMAISDMMSCNSDFESVDDLNEDEENKVVNAIMSDDDVWNKINDLIYEEVGKVIAEREKQ